MVSYLQIHDKKIQNYKQYENTWLGLGLGYLN